MDANLDSKTSLTATNALRDTLGTPLVHDANVMIMGLQPNIVTLIVVAVSARPMWEERDVRNVNRITRTTRPVSKMSETVL